MSRIIARVLWRCFFQPAEHVRSLDKGDVQIVLRHSRATETTWGTLSTPLGASSFMMPVVRKRIVGSIDTLPRQGREREERQN